MPDEGRSEGVYIPNNSSLIIDIEDQLNDLNDTATDIKGDTESLNTSQKFNSASASLANGAELDSGWLDTELTGAYQISIFAASSGLSLIIDSSESNGGGGVNDIQSNTPLQASFLATLPTRERYMRFRVQNNSGSAISNVKFDVKYNPTGGSGASVFPIYVAPAAFSPATLTQAVSIGQQPDGDYVASPSDGSALSTSSTLLGGATYTSDWVDSDGWNTIELFISSNTVSSNQGVAIQYTDDTQAGTPTVRAQKKFTFNPVDVQRGFKEVRVPASLDGFRVIYTNGAADQSAFYLDATLRVTQQPNQYNDGNSIVTSDFFTEVALGNVGNFTIDTKFGRNPDIDTGTGPEDIWNGGSTYTGFNATANENMRVVSTSAQDSGSLVSSGTITTNSTTQIEDSSATFITDGVAVGDIALNNTRGIWGIVKTVDSETTLTVWQMQDGTNGQFSNIIGNSYRIATTNGTGAAVMSAMKILNADYEVQPTQFFIMNGTTNVTNTVDAFRCTRALVLLAGSNGSASGSITGRQETTTANVFFSLPLGFNQSTIAADTVPAGKDVLIRTLEVGIVRNNGSAGSATASLRVRPVGSVFQAKRVYELQAGGNISKRIEGGLLIPEKADLKFTIDEVSDNNTIVFAEYEYVTIDK